MTHREKSRRDYKAKTKQPLNRTLSTTTGGLVKMVWDEKHIRFVPFRSEVPLEAVYWSHDRVYEMFQDHKRSILDTYSALVKGSLKISDLPQLEVIPVRLCFPNTSQHAWMVVSGHRRLCAIKMYAASSRGLGQAGDGISKLSVLVHPCTKEGLSKLTTRKLGAVPICRRRGTTKDHTELAVLCFDGSLHTPQCSLKNCSRCGSLDMLKPET
jgi:hypothetical protein